ncbi:hypothetical protein Tco_0492714 [Tanacetum coccineum]
MAEPIPEDYISVTRKNFLSGDNEGRMVEKSFLEIQGTFLVKIRDNAFNGTIKENAVEHIENFLEVVEPLKIKGVSHDRFRLSVFPISLSSAASEWFKKQCIGSVTTWEDLVEKFVQKFHRLCYNNEEMEADEDDNSEEMNIVAEIFKIRGNLFDYETPLCKEFDEFNYLLKIDTDLFTFDVQKIKTYEEYEYELDNNMTWGLKEPWSDNRVPYQLCDHICEPYRFKIGKVKWPTCSSNINGFCNGGELPGMVRVGYMTYFQDHKWYDNLIDGDLKDETLMHKARFEDIFGRNYETNNVGNTQDNQGPREQHPTHDPSVCRVRRFVMIKYSFDADDEYVAVKEHEYFDHSRTNVNACQAYQELFRIMDEGWLVTKAKEE